MEKVLIHYFSGTGNSLHAAELLSDEMKKYGCETVLHAIENGSFSNDGTYSLHIFFFPVYATAVPHIMSKYMRNLPDGKNVKAAVISTNGRINTRFRDGYQGWALHEARLLLKLKNYNVFFSDTLDYPHNITIVLPPRMPEKNQQIIRSASEKIPAIAEKLSNRRGFHRGFFWPNILWSVPFGIGYSLLARRIFGKFFVADLKCNSCKLCVKNCPANTIKCENGQIRWKLNCEGCMRCINSCPRHAIQTSTVKAIAILAVASLNPHPLTSKIIPDSFYDSIGKVGSAVFNTLLDLTLFIVSLIALDWILNTISVIPAVKKVISLGHTRCYGRYHAKQFEDKIKNKSNVSGI